MNEQVKSANPPAYGESIAAPPPPTGRASGPTTPQFALRALFSPPARGGWRYLVGQREDGLFALGSIEEARVFGSVPALLQYVSRWRSTLPEPGSAVPADPRWPLWSSFTSRGGPTMCGPYEIVEIAMSEPSVTLIPEGRNVLESNICWVLTMPGGCFYAGPGRGSFLTDRTESLARAMLFADRGELLDYLLRTPVGVDSVACWRRAVHVIPGSRMVARVVA